MRHPLTRAPSPAASSRGGLPEHVVSRPRCATLPRVYTLRRRDERRGPARALSGAAAHNPCELGETGMEPRAIL
jgi:hypothetical protein